ncbi:DUF2934 domain-containing protein [Caballeronia sordidicola]|jgi:hypothetical protein|uniref:DUF2934 domain-containing protein n=1 Tax=Caballeronia sordidicola TaxID=196367 RepID=A0A226WQK4_CABSO|nr:DUF2934 domain-containing protein [Caballeronia sordidicola]OXC73067.1 hypothetical protein BSU04_37640 [Caballeronia sordidicola]
MAERLIDVLDGSGTVIHTYPVTLGHADDPADDARYEAKALEAAAHGRLVPDAELPSLSARVHVGRGGQLASYGDDLDSRSETRQALEQGIRERAYLLWEQEGCQEGRADDYWQRAAHQQLSERAYVLWQQEGNPEGRADENWHRLREFGAQ